MGVHTPLRFGSWFSMSLSIKQYIQHGDFKGTESLCEKGKQNVNYCIILEYQSGRNFSKKSRILLMLFWFEFCCVLTHKNEGIRHILVIGRIQLNISGDKSDVKRDQTDSLL